MTEPFRISLRAGEKIYINGAVLRVDRKVTLELLNDVTFLLENHILQVDEATTPLRQLYFVVQTMLMEPQAQEPKLELFREFHKAHCEAFETPEMVEQIKDVGQLVEDGHYFNALRAIRKMFQKEDEILADTVTSSSSASQSHRSSKDGSRAA